MKRLLPRIGVIAASLLLVPGLALADGGDVTFRLDTGVAVPLTGPQADRFNVGGELTVKPMISVLPFFDLAPSATLLGLPSKISGIDTGTAWGLGGGFRFKRSRDASNTDTGFKAVSPWLDADLQYVRTGDLNRAALMIGAGAQVPTSDSRTLWVGPFVRYQDIVQGDRVGYDSTDAHVFIAGLTLEFGGAAKKADKACDEGCRDRDHDGVVDSLDRCPDVPGPVSNEGCPLGPVAKRPLPPPVPPTAPPPEPTKVEIRQRVQFNFDSASITKDAEQALAQVLQVLQAHPDWHVEIRGHASSDGPLAHNKQLAQRRAESVLAYLKKHGVPGDHMVAKGLGVSTPVAPNATEAGRVSNRRADFDVDFVIVKNGGAK